MSGPAVTVAENPDLERYEIHVDGRLAGFAEYRGHTTRTFSHTEIDAAFEGRGLGGELIRNALDDVRSRGLAVIPLCPFVKAFLAGHEEYLELVEPRIRHAGNLPDHPGATDRTGSCKT